MLPAFLLRKSGKCSTCLRIKEINDLAIHLSVIWQQISCCASILAFVVDKDLMNCLYANQHLKFS